MPGGATTGPGRPRSRQRARDCISPCAGTVPEKGISVRAAGVIRHTSARSSSPTVTRNSQPSSACGVVPRTTVARSLRREGITAFHGALETLHRREIVFDVLDLTGGTGGPLDFRRGPWGKRRQCPAVRPHGTPAERTTPAFLFVSHSPSLATRSHKAKKEPPFTDRFANGSARQTGKGSVATTFCRRRLMTRSTTGFDIAAQRSDFAGSIAASPIPRTSVIRFCVNLCACRELLGSQKRRSKSLCCHSSSQPDVSSTTSRIVRQWSSHRNSRSLSDADRRVLATIIDITGDSSQAASCGAADHAGAVR